MRAIRQLAEKKCGKNFQFCLSASGGAVQFFFRKDWTAEAGLRRAGRKNGGGGTKIKNKSQNSNQKTPKPMLNRSIGN